jgi:hypothetical protein
MNAAVTKQGGVMNQRKANVAVGVALTIAAGSDVIQVEVLKGSEGTLFGQNSTVSHSFVFRRQSPCGANG